MDLSRILIIKPSSLGDVVQAVPVAWALRELCPASRIDWLATPACAGVVDGLKALDAVIAFDRARYGQMWRSPRAMVSFAGFVARLRRPRYTAVIDLQGLFRSGFLGLVTGARGRLGLSDAREGAERFYTDMARVPAGPMSSVDRYMLAAVRLGVSPQARRRFDLEVPAEKASAARALLASRGLADGRPYVGLVPGARWAPKRWPEERYATLAQRLREGLGLEPVLVGSPGEREIAERLRRMRGGCMINLIGQTDVKTLAAVLGGAACVVCGDTGPMHLAAALGRPLVALFGPTSVETTGPYGEGHVTLADRADCARCGRRTCLWEGRRDELMCLRNISVDEVFEAVRRQVEAGRKAGETREAPRGRTRGRQGHG